MSPVTVGRGTVGSPASPASLAPASAAGKGRSATVASGPLASGDVAVITSCLPSRYGGARTWSPVGPAGTANVNAPASSASPPKRTYGSNATVATSPPSGPCADGLALPSPPTSTTTSAPATPASDPSLVTRPASATIGGEGMLVTAPVVASSDDVAAADGAAGSPVCPLHARRETPRSPAPQPAVARAAFIGS